MIRAADAGWLLSALARGGAVEVGPEQEALLPSLEAHGLIRRAAEAGLQRSELEAARAELATLLAVSASDPQLAGRVRGLRTRVLELGEQLAESEGAAEIVGRGMGGPYRDASGASSRWQLTHRGRVLLGDLAPRLMRVGEASLDAFDKEMRALRYVLGWRAQRAAEIAARITARKIEGLEHTTGSIAVGLSAARAEPLAIAAAFETTYRALRARKDAAFSALQDASAAECLVISARDLAWCQRSDAADALHELRAEALARFAQGRPEDALDSAIMLASAPREVRDARLALAWKLAEQLRATGGTITLPLALLATAGETSLEASRDVAIRAAFGALAHELPNPVERLDVAVLLTLVRGDLVTQLERWRLLRHSLTRFAPEGMSVAAALLSWLALDAPELLDDLRLASAEVQRHRLGAGGAESMTIAVKLLVSMAMLALGDEGDPEERLAFAPPLGPTGLGLHAAIAALPIAAPALVAFHRTVLDAAAAWSQENNPTHSSFVYGGGRRGSGWG